MKDASGSIGVFDFEVQEVRHVFRIENETWSSMALSPDGEILVRPETGSSDWRRHTSKGEGRLGLAAANPSCAGSACQDRRAVGRFRSLRRIPSGLLAFAFSPDGRFPGGGRPGRPSLSPRCSAQPERRRPIWFGHKAMVTAAGLSGKTQRWHLRSADDDRADLAHRPGGAEI